MRLSVSVIVLAACVFSSCGPILDVNTKPVHFSGTVAAAGTGKPIAGAVVSLEQLLFVFQGAVKSDTTDQNGRYDIEIEALCDDNTDLYEAPGKAYILVARAAGYRNESNVNNGTAIRCVKSLQTVNFNLSAAP